MRDHRERCAPGINHFAQLAARIPLNCDNEIECSKKCGIIETIGGA
jgi:hypothetical protein